VDADRGDLAVVDPHAGEVRALLGAHARRYALVGERGEQRALHGAHELDDVVGVHDRVADELAGAVVGDAPAAVDVDDVDALGAVPVFAHRQLALAGAPPARVDGRVLEQEQRVGDLVGLAARAQALLEGEGLPVLDLAEMGHPQLTRHGSHGTPVGMRLPADRAARRRRRALGGVALVAAVAAGAGARRAGRDLRAAGLNVTFAPVADVAAGPVMRGRAFPGRDAAVSALAAASVRGYRGTGVAPTLKHFPGMGAASAN